MHRSFTFLKHIKCLSKILSPLNNNVNNHVVLISRTTSTLRYLVLEIMKIYYLPIFFRHFSSAVLNNQKRTPLTHIKDLVKYIKENNYFYLKMLTNIYNTINFGMV